MSDETYNNDWPTILIVDDQLSNRLLFGEYLRSLEINIDQAESGPECLRMIKDKSYALICLDVMMPDMDGYQVLEKIHTSPQTENIPVILISAFFQTEEHVVKGISNGAIDFLSKPINSQIFISKVRNFVQLYEKQKKLDQLLKKLENTNKRLLENEHKFKKITQSASDGIIVLNSNYEIKFCNKAALDIFGFNKYEILLENIFERMLSQKSVDILRENLQSLSHSKTLLNNSIRLIGKNKLEFEFPIELSSALYKTAEDEINYTLIIRNISHQVKVEKEALAAKELREANKIMKEFIDKVSHELRTPMTAIIGISNMLLKYEAQNLLTDQVQGLKLINQSGKRLLDLINDILDVSKLEAKKSEVHMEKINFDEFLAEIRSIVITLIEDKPIKFLIRKSPAVPKYILADIKILSQILNNLLSNAVKFTLDGTVRLFIHKKDDALFFEISDTGIGISPENLKIIFHKFEQIDNSASKQQKGTGLGLFITKSLIELLKGDIKVISQLDVGTTMMFNIPIKPDESDDKENKVMLLNDFDFSEILNHPDMKLAVIIDFRYESHFLLKPILEDEKFITYSCYNSSSGMNIIKALHPDMIVLKMEMPKIHGQMVLNEIMNFPQCSAIPVIILSSISDFTQKQIANPYKIIHEPIFHKEIVEKIRTFNVLVHEKKPTMCLLIKESKAGNHIFNCTNFEICDNKNIDITKLIILRRKIKRLIFNSIEFNSNNYKVIEWLLSCKSVQIEEIYVIGNEFSEQINLLFLQIPNLTKVTEQESNKLFL